MEVEDLIKRIRNESPNDEQLKLILIQFQHCCHDFYYESGAKRIRESYHNRKDTTIKLHKKKILNFDSRLGDLSITKFSQLMKRMLLDRNLAMEFVDLFNITDCVDIEEVYRNDKE